MVKFFLGIEVRWLLFFMLFSIVLLLLIMVELNLVLMMLFVNEKKSWLVNWCVSLNLIFWVWVFGMLNDICDE